LKIEVNKKLICSICAVILLLSALIYNILYINNKKNEIIEEIETEEVVYEEVEDVKTIFVDVGGEVNNPGLYELPENSRINDAVNIAGGITDKADLTEINLAYVLSDAMKIIIPKKEIKKTRRPNGDGSLYYSANGYWYFAKRNFPFALRGLREDTFSLLYYVYGFALG